MLTCSNLIGFAFSQSDNFAEFVLKSFAVLSVFVSRLYFVLSFLDIVFGSCGSFPNRVSQADYLLTQFLPHTTTKTKNKLYLNHEAAHNSTKPPQSLLALQNRTATRQSRTTINCSTHTHSNDSTASPPSRSTPPSRKPEVGPAAETVARSRHLRLHIVQVLCRCPPFILH